MFVKKGLCYLALSGVFFVGCSTDSQVIIKKQWVPLEVPPHLAQPALKYEKANYPYSEFIQTVIENQGRAVKNAAQLDALLKLIEEHNNASK